MSSMMNKRRKHAVENTSRKADGSVVSVNPPRAENELRQCAARTTAVHQHVAQAAQGTALAGVVLKWGFFVLGGNKVEQWNCCFLYEKQVSVIEIYFFFYVI